MSAPPLTRHPILFFDGQCGLCNRSVDWLLAHDRRRVFRYSPLQGETAKALVPEALRRSAEELESVVLVDSSGIHQRSGALLRVLWHLGGAWRLALVLRLVPRVALDAAYDFVARHRYRWFGKRDTCRLPAPGERDRFLE